MIFSFLVQELVQAWFPGVYPCGTTRAQYWIHSAMAGDYSRSGGRMSYEKESLVGRRVRFRPDFYTTRLMPPRDWTGTIELERRSSSEEGRTSYIVLLDEPFRSQEQNPRVDTTEDEMEPF